MNIEVDDLSFRVAEQKDISTLSELAEEFMPGVASREQREEVLKISMERPDYELLIVEEDGRVVGFVDQFIIEDFVHGAKLSYIQNLFVTKRYRGKGLGDLLLKQIVMSSKEKGVSEIHVATEFENESAIKLYKKRGFLNESLLLENNVKEQKSLKTTM